MNRKMYLQVPVVLIGTLILAALLMLAWIILAIPVMLKPSIVAGFKPGDKITEYMTRRMIQSAMKGNAKHAQSGAPE